MWKVGGGLVGVVTLCGDVGLVGGGRKMAKLKGLGGVVYPQEGMTKRDLLSSFALCTVDGAAHLHKNTKGTHIMISSLIVYVHRSMLDENIKISIKQTTFSHM